MGKIEVHSPVIERSNLQKRDIGLIDSILSAFTGIRKEIDSVRDSLSPVLRKEYEVADQNLQRIEGKLQRIRELLREERTLEELRDLDKTLRDLLEFNIRMIDQKDGDWKVETDPQTGERRILEFKGTSQRPRVDPEPILSELNKISKEGKSSQIQVPKDLWEAQIHSTGDLLMTQDEKVRNNILKLQGQGKLLAGTLEGLSGGKAYLKVFTIALAQTLNEQSRHYKTEGDWSGIPKTLIPEIFGSSIKTQKEGTTTINDETRSYPYVIISYEDMSKKIRGSETGGGKDSKEIADYIQDLSEKQYLYQTNTGVILGIPFLVKEISVYSGKTGVELGCLVRLSPQFSKTLRGYTGLRSDTIKLLGGGKQRELTMNLLDYLIYSRGVPQKGRRRGEFAVRKEDLLRRISTGRDYGSRPGLLDKHFKEGIQKAIDTKILLSGRKKSGELKGYWEEDSPGGDRLSVFAFNPNYLQGERIDVDIQDGE